MKWTAKYLPAQDVRALIQASGAAAEKAVKLEQVDADNLNLSAFDAWLSEITGAAPATDVQDHADGG